LITLVGPGGVGKTRLAQEAALRCGDRFADGVFWVPLQDVLEPDLVLPTVAQALGATRSLREHLAEQHALIVLDNVEQVADAAGQAAALLIATGRTKVVSTSREPLRLSGEHRLPVEPLPEEDAAALFAERAREVDPTFEPSRAVAGVVDRLDRLPLAIELAAARLNAMSTEGLLARMERRLPLLAAGQRDAPERQRTLTATLAWSYELLDEAERRLFRRLAVFAGGFELEAAERVCGADLDTLQALVDKSLVQKSREGRLRLLETVREYAGMRLQHSDELDELSSRHAAWALELAERAKPAFVPGERQDEVLPRLEAERANLRAARDWLRRSGDAERGLQLAVAVAPLWQIRGPIDEGRGWLTRALGDVAGGPAEARGEALRLLSRFALAQGDLDAAADYARAGVEYLRELPPGPTLAAALTDLANALSATGEFEQARLHYEESLDLYRRGADDASTVNRGRVLGNLGYVALMQGDLERAPTLLREALASGGALDVQYTALHTLGLAHLARGEYEQARAYLVDSLRLSAVAQDDAIAYCLVGFGALALEEGDDRLAATLLISAETLFARAGAKPNPYEEALIWSATADARARLGSDAFEAASRAGAELSSTEVIRLVLGEGYS
jgi:predicted ATPase